MKTKSSESKRAIGTIMVKGSTKITDRVWAMDASCETWAPYLGCAPRFDEATRAAIRQTIEAAGFPVIEED